MYDDHAAFFRLQPIAHAGHDVRYEGERRGMVIGEGVVVYTVVNLAVRVASAFCTKLPYRPVFTMFGVEELYEGVERIPVRALWIGATGARRSND